LSDTGDPRLAASPEPGFLRKHGLKLLVSLVVTGGLVYLLHKGALPLVPPKSSFAQMRWWTVPAYVAVWSFVHCVRAARWTFLLTPIAKVPMRRILAVSFIGFAAIVLLPVRMGEVARPYLIRREGHLSGWAATGTIAAERIIDGLFLSLMLLFGLAFSTPLSPLPDRIGALEVSPAIVPKLAYFALVGFAGAFLVMGLFYWQRAFARRATEVLIGWISPRFATLLADKVEHVASGLRFLPNLSASVPFIAGTGAYWLLNAAGTWLMAWGTGFDDFTYGQAVVTTGVVALGLLAPNAPGFFGAYQVSFYAALAVFYPYDQVVGPGAACVLLVYSMQLLVTLVAGAIGLLMERLGVGDVLHGPSPAENLPPAPAPQ